MKIPAYLLKLTLMAGTEQDASLTFLVPLDDTHTWFLMHMAERPGTPLPPSE